MLSFSSFLLKFTETKTAESSHPVCFLYFTNAQCFVVIVSLQK